MSTLNDLTITLRAVDKTKRAFSAVTNRIKALTKITVGLTAAIGGVGIATSKMFTSEELDRLAKTSDTLNTNVQSLQAFRREANLSGVSVNDLDKALLKMNQNIGKAINGTGEAAKTLKRLNLDAAELAKLDPAQAYIAIEQAISRLPTAPQRATAAMDIFGRAGAEVTRITGENLVKANAEIERFGIQLTRLDLVKVEAANDAVFRTGENAKGVTNIIKVGMSSAIVAFNNLLLDTSANFLGANRDSLDFGRSVVRGVGWVLDAFSKFQDGLGFIRIGINFIEQAFAKLFANTLRDFQAFLEKIPGGKKLAEKFGLDDIEQFFRDRVESTTQDIANIQQGILDRYQSGTVTAQLEQYFNEAEIAAIKRAQEIQANIAASTGNFDLGNVDGGVSTAGNVPAESAGDDIEAGVDSALFAQYRAATEASQMMRDSTTKALTDMQNAGKATSTNLTRDFGFLATAMGNFSRAAEVNGSKSAKTFQKLQIALSTAATWAGAAQVLADPKLFFAQKLAAFSTILATGFGAVDAIKSLSSSRSAQASPDAAVTNSPLGATAPPEINQGTPQRNVNVNITDNGFFTADQVEAFIDTLNDLDTGTQINLNRVAA